MQNQKYSLSEPTKEEQEAFTKGLGELCEKMSMYFEPVPVFNRPSLETPTWQVACQIFLQKKTLIGEVQDAEIVSPLSEEMTK